jgi:hypothetical protein
MPTVHLLDYVAGNVRSLVNAINKVGYEVEWVRSPSDLKAVEVRKFLSSPLCLVSRFVSVFGNAG